MSETLAFIGGGNMASAIVAGLLRAGHAAASIIVVEPFDAQRERLRSQWKCVCWPRPTRRSASAGARRLGREAAELSRRRAPCAPHVGERVAAQRDGRHPQRRDRAGDGQRSCRAFDAQHAGADRPRHRRPVCAPRRDARRPQRWSRPCWRRPAPRCGSTTKRTSTPSPRCRARVRPTSTTSSKR